MSGIPGALIVLEHVFVCQGWHEGGMRSEYSWCQHWQWVIDLFETQDVVVRLSHCGIGADHRNSYLGSCSTSAARIVPSRSLPPARMASSGEMRPRGEEFLHLARRRRIAAYDPLQRR